MKPYMLDTNICSFIIREEPQQVLHNFERAALDGRAITVSAITYIELLYGAISPRAPKKVLQGVRDFVACLDEISPLDAAAIAKGAEIQRELLKKARPSARTIPSSPRTPSPAAASSSPTTCASSPACRGWTCRTGCSHTESPLVCESISSSPAQQAGNGMIY